MAESGLDPARAAEVARRAAQAGGEAALRRWRGEIGAKLKADRSVVTLADTEAEAAILAVIREAFPDHAVLAEESGSSGEGALTWIVDPLDGTSGFSRGGAMWGPIIALVEGEEPLAGAMALPAFDRLYWAGKGKGAWREEGERVERVRLAAGRPLGEAILSLGQIPALYGGRAGEPLSKLCQEVRSVRCYGDVAGAAMLLDGQADAWIESGVKPWDLAGVAALVGEAGGTFTDLAGGKSLRSGSALAGAKEMHAQILARLGGPGA